MTKTITNSLKVLLSVGVAGLLLYLVFRNIEWADFWQKAKTVNYSWVILSILLSLITYFGRAYRWNLLLKPLGHDLKISRTTIAVIIGYFANLALPRLGEITRCGVLKRNDNVPVPVALGTVVVDRMMDLLALFVLLLISLLLEYDLLVQFLSNAYSDLAIPKWVLIAVISTGILGIGLLILFIRKQHKLNGKMAELLKAFVQGMISLKDVKNPMGFIGSTILIWIIYFFMSYLIVFSLPETSHLSLSAGLMLLVTGGIAIALPVQSGFGTYHGMIAGMLLLYSIEFETGIFLATLLHTSQIVAIAFFGTIATVLSFLIRRNNANNEGQNSESETSA